MRDTRQLTMLTDLAQERRDAAARKLGRSIAMLKESEQRLALLAQYREDYRARLADLGARGLCGDEWRNFRHFIARLDEAIGQQKGEVQALTQGVSECRDHWLLERRKERSYDVLTERADLAEREREGRRLQKILDEFSGRMAQLRMAG